MARQACWTPSNAGIVPIMMLLVQGAQPRSQLRLELVPLDDGTASAMVAAGYHPYLALTLSASKSLLSVLCHLGTKWQRAAPPPDAVGGSNSGSSRDSWAALYVHAPADCPIALRGVRWGGPDCDSQLKASGWVGVLAS